MDCLYFSVQGSAKDPYKVSFLRRENNITATCTCKAGIHRMHCKHRINLLSGVTKGLVSDNEPDVEELLSWIPGSDLDGLLQEFHALQKQTEEIKRAFSAVKKRLSKALLD